MSEAKATRCLRDIVPVKFYNEKLGGRHPQANTVGELIAILQELPPDLTFGDDDVAQVYVANIGDPNRVLVKVEIDDPAYFG